MRPTEGRPTGRNGRDKAHRGRSRRHPIPHRCMESPGVDHRSDPAPSSPRTGVAHAPLGPLRRRSDAARAPLCDSTPPILSAGCVWRVFAVSAWKAPSFPLAGSRTVLHSGSKAAHAERARARTLARPAAETISVRISTVRYSVSARQRSLVVSSVHLAPLARSWTRVESACVVEAASGCFCPIACPRAHSDPARAPLARRSRHHRDVGGAPRCARRGGHGRPGPCQRGGGCRPGSASRALAVAPASCPLEARQAYSPPALRNYSTIARQLLLGSCVCRFRHVVWPISSSSGPFDFDLIGLSLVANIGLDPTTFNGSGLPSVTTLGRLSSTSSGRCFGITLKLLPGVFFGVRSLCVRRPDRLVAIRRSIFGAFFP